VSSGLAYLRVYEPIEAFPEADRPRWAAYAAAHADDGPAAALARERRAALAGALCWPPRLPPEELDDGEAYVLVTGAGPLLCPWRTRTRARAAIASADVAEGLRRLGYPEHAIRDADEEDRAVRPAGGHRLPVIAAGAPLPPSWLMLFEPGDRAPSTPARGGAPAGTAQALIYRTAMAKARQRAARVVHLLRREAVDAEGFHQLQGVARWLEEFHPHSVVELDYADLTAMFAPDQLAAEDSVGVVGRAAARLAEGEPAAAYQLMETLIMRWRELAAGQATN
jgi:hypothetical protein